MWLLLLLSTALAAANPRPLHPPCATTFDDFKLHYGKRYGSKAEEDYRKQIFYHNRGRLNRHNANPNRTYDMRPNHFLDVRNEEFAVIYGGAYQSDDRTRKLAHRLAAPAPRRTLTQEDE